jgi:transcription termination/antitermination protein NusA
MAAVKLLATERGIDAEDVYSTLQHAMLAAYRKDYPEESEEGTEIEVSIGRKTGEVTLLKNGKDITPPGFGRIAAQTAKQVILQGVREAEKNAAIEEFRQKLGKVVSGMLQRLDHGTWIVDIGRTLAMMPKEEQVFGEDYNNNQRLKVVVKEIRENDVYSDIIVSRSDPQLVHALFEIEVPEVQSKAVVIKNIAREPGSRSKIAVASTQEGVDPVGSMVGQRGVRVSAITNELNGEKMDIILWSESITKYIINALAPAQVSDVIIDEKRKTAKVEVRDDQLSLAIGKDGQNVRLASKLAGYKIDIVAEAGHTAASPTQTVSTDDADGNANELITLGLTSRITNKLAESGITKLEELKLMTEEQLGATPGIGPKAVKEIQDFVASH